MWAIAFHWHFVSVYSVIIIVNYSYVFRLWRPLKFRHKHIVKEENRRGGGGVNKIPVYFWRLAK